LRLKHAQGIVLSNQDRRRNADAILDAKIDAYVKRLLAEAPKLSREKRERLAVLLQGGDQ
jgi:hypothetical protein